MITLTGPRLTPAPSVDVPDALRARIEAAGSAAAAARALSVSTSYLLDVRHGRRPASARLLEALGLERVVVAREADRG